MRLRQLREAKGKLQKEVAYDLGIERSKYVKYETEKVEPSIEMLIKMADYYHVTVDYLIEHILPWEETGIDSSFSVTKEEQQIVESFRNSDNQRKSIVCDILHVPFHQKDNMAL